MQTDRTNNGFRCQTSAGRVCFWEIFGFWNGPGRNPALEARIVWGETAAAHLLKPSRSADIDSLQRPRASHRPVFRYNRHRTASSFVLLTYFRISPIQSRSHYPREAAAIPKNWGRLAFVTFWNDICECFRYFNVVIV